MALATARAEVEVRLDGRKVKANVDDDKSYVRAKAVDMGDLGDGDRGRSSGNDIALSDDQNYYRKGSTAAARQRDRMSQLSGKSVQIRRPMSQVFKKVENVE